MNIDEFFGIMNNYMAILAVLVIILIIIYEYNLHQKSKK